MTYKVRSTATPFYLCKALTTKQSSDYSLLSSCIQQLTVPRVRTELAKRAFRVAAPSIENGLPVNVQSTATDYTIG